MTDIMLDSSVWIDYFRKGQGEIFNRVDMLLDQNRIVLCGIVEFEIIQGIREKERHTIKELFGALPYVDFLRRDFVRAGEILNSLRKTGITIPPSDCLIATLCIRLDIMLLTFDKHFEAVSNLKRFT